MRNDLSGYGWCKWPMIIVRSSLFEHHGDCSPGGAIRIETDELESFHKQLLDRQYKYARLEIQERPWGSRDMLICDPFGNK